MSEEAEVMRYSRTEVSQNNETNSLWLIIDNNVYDVSKFINEVGHKRRFQGVRRYAAKHAREKRSSENRYGFCLQKLAKISNIISFPELEK